MICAAGLQDMDSVITSCLPFEHKHVPTGNLHMASRSTAKINMKKELIR